MTGFKNLMNLYIIPIYIFIIFQNYTNDLRNTTLVFNYNLFRVIFLGINDFIFFNFNDLAVS